MSKVGLGAALAACAIASVLISAVALAGLDSNLGKTNGVHYTRAFKDAAKSAKLTAKCGSREHVSSGGWETVNNNGSASASLPVDGSDGDKKPDDGWLSKMSGPDTGTSYAYAICVKGKITYRSADGKVKVGKTKTVKAACPNGTKVIGGGGDTGGGNAIATTAPYDSGDGGSATDDGWQVKTFGENARTMTVWAVCADMNVSYKAPESEIPGPGNLGFAGQCPSAKSIVGIGVGMTGPGDEIRIPYLYSEDTGTDGDSIPDDKGSSFVYNDGLSPKTYTPTGICR